MKDLLCSACPLFWFCELAGIPHNEADERLLRHNAALTAENASLRELAIENGLNYGAGKNYVEGNLS